MKKVELRRPDGSVKRGVYIETPWLRIEEAAAYCGISRSSFMARARNLAHAGDDNCRLYHVRLLDQFVKGELPEAPFNPAKAIQKKRRRRRQATVPAPEPMVINPLNGKIIRASEERNENEY
jgi:hypothetical protein